MVTQNHFVISATVLEKFISRGWPEGVTQTTDHCKYFNTKTLIINLYHLITTFIIRNVRRGCLKGCVTENANVPLISTIQVGFSNCTGLLSRDSTPGICTNLTFKKMHFFVYNPEDFSRED